MIEQTARFFRKPAQAELLLDDTPIIKPTPFRVTKVEELTQQQFHYFSQHLLEDTLFLIRDRDLMGWDQDGVRCVLVTSQEQKDGILVNTEGYDYARYAAHLPDKSLLDLADIPVQRYSDIPTKAPKQRRGHRER